MKLKAVYRRMLQMCEPAWFIFLRSLQLSCLMLFCCLMLLWDLPTDAVRAHAQYILAMAMLESPQGLLLIGLLASVILEDQSRRSS